MLDEYGEGDECAVLMPDGRVLALSPIACTALEAIGEGEVGEADVVRALIAVHGVPRDDADRDLSDQLTAGVVEELERNAVVTQVVRDGSPE